MTIIAKFMPFFIFHLFLNENISLGFIPPANTQKNKNNFKDIRIIWS